MTPHDLSILEELRDATLGTLRLAIDTTQPVALVDIPGHTNVGDLMIYAGELAYFKKLQLNVVYKCDVQRFDAGILRSRMPEGTVLIHGGGNLGDTWPEHQAFKESVTSQLPDYRIVHLPQSIYFADTSNAKRANAILAGHPDTLVLVRDQPSLERADRDLPGVETRFVPDLALGWDAPSEQYVKNADPRTLVLARKDREGSSELSRIVEPALRTNDTVVDWYFNNAERGQYILSRIAGKLSNGRASHAKRTVLYLIIAGSLDSVKRVNLHAGIRIFAGADIVVTDRLHAHVLATLMGIPNIALDNSYGKVGAIYEDYTHRFSTSHFATSESELMEIWEALRS